MSTDQDYMCEEPRTLYPFKAASIFLLPIDGDLLMKIAYFLYFSRCSTKSLWRKYSECIAKSRCSRINACVVFCRSVNDWNSCFLVLSSYLTSTNMTIGHIINVSHPATNLIHYGPTKNIHSIYHMNNVIGFVHGLQRNFYNANSRHPWLNWFAREQTYRYSEAALTLSTASLAYDLSRRVVDPFHLSNRIINRSQS